MKTKWIALRMPKLVPWLIASILVIASNGCEDFPNEPLVDLPEDCLFGNVHSESFTVYPGSTLNHKLDGVVTLEFPEGAVTEPTTFFLSTSNLDPMDEYGYNLMYRTISLKTELTSDSKTFEIPVKIKMNYKVAGFMNSLESPEDNLTIYNLNESFYAYSIGECCVDCECKTVDGCINQCGTFVVGEN